MQTKTTKSYESLMQNAIVFLGLNRGIMSSTLEHNVINNK